MLFKKYSSIENSYRGEYLARIDGHGFERHEYIVQEKAHGSNLSYWTSNGIDFYAAKRSARLEADEKFYNSDVVLETLKSSFSNIWNKLSASYTLTDLAIFGEIIGGNYPHKDVGKDNKSSKVQKGIFYCPDNRFYAFDIMINGETYLDVDEAVALFEQEGLFHAKTLFRGSLKDCLAYPNEFDSLIPKELGLPAITPNICEGVIIRPIVNLHFNNGTRVILKNKNERWSENMKFNKVIKKTEPLPEKIVKLQEGIQTYVTENRLNNVLSKIGAVTMNDFGKVLGMFNKDVVEDFSKDFGEHINTLEKKEVKLVTKSINKTAVALVKKKLMV